MIHCYIDNKIVCIEEYLIDFSLKTGKFIDDIVQSLHNMSIKFDGQEINAFIIGSNENGLVVQLALPIKSKFNDTSNRYETSYIRKLINSNEFLSRFNPEFLEHIYKTNVHTEDYTTYDKLWLLSHEEVNQYVDFLECNQNCHPFELFNHVNLGSYSKTLLKTNDDFCCSWRLRSAGFYHDIDDYIISTGSVGDNGYVFTDNNYNIYSAAILPACTIC